MRIPWKRKILSAEEKAARWKLRKWHLWSGAALILVDLVLFLGLVGVLFVPFWLFSDNEIGNRIWIALMFLSVSSLIPAIYIVWTWFTVGWRLVAPHSILLYFAVWAANVADAKGFLPFDFDREGGLRDFELFGDWDMLVFKRLDIPILILLGAWLITKKFFLGTKGSLVFQWMLFLCIIWNRPNYSFYISNFFEQ